MGAEARKRAFTEDNAADASAAATGKRHRGPEGVAGNSDELLRNQEARCRAGGLHLALVADKEAVKEDAYWRNPELQSRLVATQAPAAEGAGIASSAWVAEECNRVSGQDLTEGGGELHEELAGPTAEGGAECVAAT